MTGEDWDMFTDEQKDLIADAIDASGERANRAEGLSPGDDLAYEPEPRWWRPQVRQDAAA